MRLLDSKKIDYTMHYYGDTGAVSGTLIFRLDPDLIPDPQRLYQALVQADPRLMFSAARDSAILFRAPQSTAEDLLRAAVPVMEKVSAAVGNAEPSP